MIRSPGFFEAEKEAPLLIRNFNFLKPASINSVLDRVGDWPDRLGLSQDQNDPVKFSDPIRIIVHDAERTFKTQPNRDRLVDILSQFNKDTGDYHQAICAVTSFLLLFFDDYTTTKMISHIHENLLNRYWRAEAVNFAVDAYLFQRLIESQYPQVAAHLEKLGILPETFCQKWFMALCVHVLPFETLVSFYENFLVEGFPFLIKFGLALVDLLQDEILATKVSSKVFQMFRLDEGYITGDDLILLGNRIVTRAGSIILPAINYPLWREEIYSEKLKDRLERAKLAQEEASDPEDEDVDEINSGEEDGEVEGLCQICKENYFDYVCADCDKSICQMCHKAQRDSHLKSHRVTERD